MDQPQLTPRAQAVVDRFQGWASRSTVRRVVAKVLLTVVGPVIVVVGIAMTFLPGPGLVVMALGFALLALEYAWAARALAFMGWCAVKAKEAALPNDGSAGRRVLGLSVAAAFGVATFALTTVITTYLGTRAIL